VALGAGLVSRHTYTTAAGFNKSDGKLPPLSRRFDFLFLLSFKGEGGCPAKEALKEVRYAQL